MQQTQLPSLTLLALLAPYVCLCMQEHLTVASCPASFTSASYQLVGAEAVKRSKAEGPFTFGLPEIAAAATEQQAAKPDAAVAFDGSSLPVANGSHA